MKRRPDDFAVRYAWLEGALPPPYHYEYEIHVGPAQQGKIIFCPDYPMYDPPVWTEEFPVDDEKLDQLYALMTEKEIFQKRWVEIEPPPVGGSLESMIVIAHGGSFAVPSAIEEAETVEGMYAFIRSLVPASMWTKLLAQREEYEQCHRTQE